jgi:hypothetical protein
MMTRCLGRVPGPGRCLGRVPGPGQCLGRVRSRDAMGDVRLALTRQHGVTPSSFQLAEILCSLSNFMVQI